jgi:predicted transcriptional regulator
MSSSTFTVRVETAVLKRLEKLAKSTGRSRSFLAAEALNDYLGVNEWQMEGIKKAIASLDRGEPATHDEVKRLVGSWAPQRKRRSGKA